MPLKFRLKGLAETFVDDLCCKSCGNTGGSSGDEGFETSLTRVTYEGIVVVVECKCCGAIFVPESQRFGIINSQRLRDAVDKDSLNTGQPVVPDARSVKLNVEQLNAERDNRVH